VKFGVGKVLAITDSGRDYLVTADFPGWGVKKMYASFAKLIKEE
jgi:DNA helicase-2/ATP-dependent DNA helicase PcrA